MNVYSEGFYGYNRGYYSYKNENMDIKTRYVVEYTDNQKIVDMMDTSQFNFDMLNKREFNYLEDAVSFWNSLYYSEIIVYVMMFEEIILDGEIILEQCKDMVVPSVLNEISKQRIKRAETAMEEYKKENELYRKFLEKYNISMERVIEETEEES